ncbi:MAG: CorA family divalent cation transporter [Desulfobacterales bacterium]|nr:CorA family divalent cation transporter [Desulfobacterales bacterium]
MFPFRINNPKEKEKVSVDIANIFNAFEESGWEYKEYVPDETPANYSEYFYFHKYVRNAVFEKKNLDTVKKLFKSNNDKLEVISYYFGRKTDQESYIEFHLKNREEPYHLSIDHISLRLFETGIGIIAIELLNYNYEEIKDILHINDFGRRIYPQYLADNGTIEATKDSFLADRIVFQCKDIYSDECLSYDKYFKSKIQIASYMEKLLGERFLKVYEFTPIIDDRMYTICWYGSDYWSNRLGEKDQNTGELAYESSEEWYKFIFIDGRYINCSSEKMKRELIEKHTYKRWTTDGGNGTFYSISRYSMMCLSSQQGFPYNILRNHMQRMYYQMAVIVLAQRASILKFAADVTKISGDIEVFIGKQEETSEEKQQKRESLEKITEQVKELHSAYIRFINRLWYTEVTPQEQGIEMYNMALESMGLKEQVRELQSEIKELYEFVSISLDREQMIIDREQMKLDRKSNEQMKILTILGAIFLPMMVLTGFFGMNLYFIDQGLHELIKMWIGRLNIENYPLLIQLVTWLPGFKYIPSFFL